jgi:hypothetical protein
MKPGPGCTVSATGGGSDFTMTVEQADNAATIAGVGLRLGMPNHAVTIALATALQESKLSNLSSGDRDSAGLFQQRPSQGWGTYTQVTDPVYASTAFYRKLSQVSGWTQLSVTEAAQAVQRSGAPDAYAQWESEARAAASALTGERAAGLTCHDLALATPTTTLASIATAELGTAQLSGQQDTNRGWALSAWLVAHAARFGVDQVSFDGQTWTAGAGAWSQTGAANGQLAVHQINGAA